MIYGVGQGPAVAFSPGTQVSVYSGNSPYVVAGTAVDAAGDLFIAENQGTGNNNGLVVKVAANGPDLLGPTLPTPLEYPQGLAMDGAGNLYIADNNKNAVIEIPAGCNSSCAQEQILPNPLGLRSQLGVAVDGAGDVFFSDFLDGEVGEVPASGGAETVVYSPGPVRSSVLVQSVWRWMQREKCSSPISASKRSWRFRPVAPAAAARSR